MTRGNEGLLWQADFPIDEVIADLEYFGRDFADVIDSDAFAIPEQSVALLLEDGAITHAGIAERGPHVATRKRRLTFRGLTRIGPMSLDSLRQLMPLAASNRLMHIAADNSVRVPPATWRALLQAVRRLDPAAAEAISELGPRQPVHASRGRLVQSEERDAVLLSLAIVGIRRPALRLPENGGMHFLGSLDGLEVSEDRLIEHDASQFPGWVPEFEQPAVARTFADATGRVLTVMNVNRGPVEKATGVDLVYYREDTNSFVLVQYKRLRHEPPVWVYRPASDRNWRKELERMEAVASSMADADAGALQDYHFEPSPFFVKLCRPLAVELSTRELVGGLYLPLQYWKLLEKSPEARGPRGGVAIGFHNAGKWLTSTLFVDLLQRDWLGSGRGASAVLREIIQSSLGLGRSAMVAIESARARGGADAFGVDELAVLDVTDDEGSY